MLRKAPTSKTHVFISSLCITLVVIIILLAFFSRTIENSTLTKVKLFPPFSGSITKYDSDYSPSIIRFRSLANIIVEDIHVMPGDEIEIGQKIASVYPKSVDRELERLYEQGVYEGEQVDFLCTIKQNNYCIISTLEGNVLTIAIETDSTVCCDDILLKLLPKGEKLHKKITNSYDFMVPISALTPLSENDYLIYFAIPMEGRGEAGRYKVVTQQVKILDSDGTYAAINIGLWDNRQVIIESEKSVSHMQIVLAN